MTLTEQVRSVHTARCRAAEVSALLKAERDAWEQAHAPTIAKLKELTEGVAVAEAVLREMTLLAYAADPTNKQPAPGVGIQDNPNAYDLDYDEQDVVEWLAKLEHWDFLAVKQEAFKKLALLIKPRFVQFNRTPPKAVIATDLSKAVEAIEAERASAQEEKAN